jgi:hypothetical protein
MLNFMKAIFTPKYSSYFYSLKTSLSMKTFFIFLTIIMFLSRTNSYAHSPKISVKRIRNFITHYFAKIKDAYYYALEDTVLKLQVVVFSFAGTNNYNLKK